ncbi:hypothetical protein IV203_029082 [Nitzschia inconspicua]|uniref:Uncharacterized protein n=1 Tax=Nitzschia inconspicua TaxID=303405 RepID=A0A9K3LQG9_9STRA|nr:hypothetical protein IV203_029082 [Nitzschia inconspicua]
MSTSSNGTSDASKKRKARGSESSDGKKTKTNGDSDDLTDFSMLTLEDIQSKIESLCDRVPSIPECNFGVTKENNGNTSLDSPIDESLTKEWAAQLQAILEEFNLCLSCVATATYKWGTDRSGAADQNLSLLSGEMAASQDQISSTVTPRLTNVLAPVVDLVIEKTVTTKNQDGSEVKENQFTRMLVDPDFLSLCHRILARNAPMLRQVVLSNFHKTVNAIQDYLKAQTNDTQHSRGFTY